MTFKEKYNSIDQSKLPETAKAYMADFKKDSDNFTNKQAMALMMPVLDRFIKGLKDSGYGDAIKGGAKKETKKAETPKEMAKEIVEEAVEQPETKTGKPKIGKISKGDFMKIAKEIRKEGESWNSAMKRAGDIIRTQKEVVKKEATRQYEKLKKFIEKHPEVYPMDIPVRGGGFRKTTINRDAPRVALPKGKRVSKAGWKNQYGKSDGGKIYYEYRSNRYDTRRQRYPFLADGGEVDAIFADGGKTGKMYFKEGDIVYVFQSALDKNGKLRKGIDQKFVVGDKQKWAKVEVKEIISDELGWERYRGEKIDGDYDLYDRKAKNGEMIAFFQSSSSKYNNKPIAMGYTEEERFYAKGGELDINKYADNTEKYSDILNEYETTIVNNINNKIKYWQKNNDESMVKMLSNDLKNHLSVIEYMREGFWNAAYDEWRNMDTSSREEITNRAYELLMEKNNLPTYAKGGEVDAIFADGGMIAYVDDNYENKVGTFASLLEAKKFAKANKWKYETITFEDENGDTIVVSKDDTFKDVDWLFQNKYAKGGELDINKYAGAGMFAEGGIVKNIKEDIKLINSRLKLLEETNTEEAYQRSEMLRVQKANLEALLLTYEDSPEYETRSIGATYYARGGYMSKGELVWNKLSTAKRHDFLHEHFHPEMTPRSIEILVNKSYNFLPKKVKIKMESVYANVEEYAGGGKTNEKLDLLENELTAAGIYVQRLLDMEKVPYLTIFAKSDPILENNFFFINKSGKYEMGNHYWDGDSEKAHVFDDIESIMKYVRSENFKTIADKQMEGKYAKGGKIRSEKEFNDLVAKKTKFVENLTDSGVMKEWNSNAFGVKQGISKPMTLDEAKKPLSRNYLINLLVENELSEEEYNTYFAKGGRINVSKSKTWKQEWTSTKGENGYDILEIVDTDFFSNRYSGGKVVRSKIIESSKPERVGKFEENSKIEMRKIFAGRYPFAYPYDEEVMMAKGGYTATGEDYEYVNTFGIAHPDFEEIVEAWHKGNSLRNTDRINSRLVFRKMENKYGEDKIEEVSEYIMKTHEGHEHYAKGGEMGKLGAGVYRVGKPKKVSPYSYEQKIVEIFENGDISTASDYARKASDFYVLSKYPVISEKQLEAQYKYAKGGSISKSTTYVPNRDIKELMVVLKGELTKLKGKDILDGVYVKNNRKPAGNKNAAKELLALFKKEAKNDPYGGEVGIDESDIEKLLGVGLSEQDVKNILLGYSPSSVQADTEFGSTISGLITYTGESQKGKIDEIVTYVKNGYYEIGLKYPEGFDWKAIVKKYEISKTPKVIYTKTPTRETEYEIYLGDGVVVGHIRSYKYKGDEEWSEPDVYGELDSNNPKFENGYWGIVTKKKEDMYFIVDSLLKQSKGYVKDIALFNNNLGGIGSDEVVNEKFAMGGVVDMYKIVEGYDHYNDKPLYTVESTGDNPNEYVGEYHDNIDDAREELNNLIAAHKSKNKFAKGGGFDQYGNPMGFERDYDTVYEIHHKPEMNSKTPYMIWDKMDGVYVGAYQSRQRAIEWIESNSYYAKGGYMAAGGELGYKERAEKYSIKLAKAYQKLIDTNFDDREYLKYKKLFEESQIPKEELRKIETYVATTPKGQQRPIDIYRYWGAKFADGGELVDKTIDRSGRYLDIVGNHRMLHIHLNDEGREMVMEERENGRGDEEIMYELFEDVAGNSDLMYHTDLGESGFGMTSSSGVTAGYVYGDDGELEPADDTAVVYVDNDSYRRSPIDEMLHTHLVLKNSDFMAKGGMTFGGKMAGAGIFADGGEIPQDKSLKYFIMNEASSGSIANKTPYNSYKDIDGVRLTAFQILLRDGDREYSLQNFTDLIKQAVEEYEENKYEMSYAKGGHMGKKTIEKVTLIFDGKEHKYDMVFIDGEFEEVLLPYSMNTPLFDYLEREFDDWMDSASRDYHDMYFSDEAIYSKRGAIQGAIEIIDDTISEDRGKKKVYNLDKGEVDTMAAYS